ncbi:MAG: hypothetical protein NTV63_04850 [Candidatus Woesearchaeota archaeon]|nr:hypothetical protein [Candidatus Woesearchaeota archaeon]
MEIDKSAIDMIVRKLSRRFDSNIGVAYLVGDRSSEYLEVEDVSFPEQKSQPGYAEIGETEQIIELERLHKNNQTAIGVVQYNASYYAIKGAAEKDIFDELIFLPCIRLIVNRKGEYSFLGEKE